MKNYDSALSIQVTGDVAASYTHACSSRFLFSSKGKLGKDDTCVSEGALVNLCPAKETVFCRS